MKNSLQQQDASEEDPRLSRKMRPHFQLMGMHVVPDAQSMQDLLEPGVHEALTLALDDMQRSERFIARITKTKNDSIDRVWEVVLTNGIRREWHLIIDGGRKKIEVWDQTNTRPGGRRQGQFLFQVPVAPTEVEKVLQELENFALYPSETDAAPSIAKDVKTRAKSALEQAYTLSPAVTQTLQVTHERIKRDVGPQLGA